MNRQHRNRNTLQAPGFTLVEIMIAMTLLSLVLVMLYNALYSAGVNWRASERQIAFNDTQRLELDFLRKQLGQAVPLVLMNNDDNPVVFRGERDSIRFVSSLPSHHGGGGLSVLTIRFRAGDEAGSLVLNYQPVSADTDLGPDPDTDTGPTTLILNERVDSVDFSYYGQLTDDDLPAWHDTWDSPNRLPVLVALRITPVQPTDYRPEMLIPVYTRVIQGRPEFTLFATNTSSELE